MKYLLSLVLVLMCTVVFSQTEDVQLEKRVKIVKKSIDEKGNETVEEIELTGEDAEAYINKMESETIEMEVEVDAIDENEFEVKTTKTIMVMDSETSEIKTYSSEDEVPSHIKIKIKEAGVDLENIHSESKEERHIKIIKKTDDGEEKVIEWNGEGEIPAEIREQLEKEGLDIEEMSSGHETTIRVSSRSNHDRDGNHNHDHSHDEGGARSNTAFLGVHLEESENGAKVVHVQEGSAALSAGMKDGDVIYKIGKSKIYSAADVVAVIQDQRPGDVVKIKYIRNGKKSKTKAKLKKKSRPHIIHRKASCDGQFTGDKEIDVLFKRISTEEPVMGSRIYEEEIEIIEERKGDPIDPNLLQLSDFKVFPNPSSGTFQLAFKGNPSPISIRIVDSSGKRVYTEEVQNFSGSYQNQIVLKDAAKGAIMINIKQDGRLFSEGMIIN